MAEARFPGRAPAAAGFTLLEVIVALTILALVLTTALAVLTSGNRLAGRAEEELALAQLAESVLARALVEGGSGRRQLEGRDGALSWRVERQPVQIPRAEPARRAAPLDQPSRGPLDRQQLPTPGSQAGSGGASPTGTGSPTGAAPPPTRPREIRVWLVRAVVEGPGGARFELATLELEKEPR